MTAVISPCKRYRYLLTRKIWQHPLVSQKFKVTFIMLNPSTADAFKDDPTIRRCLHFASRTGATEMSVVNLYAYRATNPNELKHLIDPVGPLNEKYVYEEIASSHLVIAAWGGNKSVEKSHIAYHLRKIPNLKCLGKTKKGLPCHPLYIPNKTPMEPWP